MKSLFDRETYQEVKLRIESLQENSQRQWGSMNVKQMMKHCQQPLEVANGTLVLDKPNALMKMVMKLFKSSLYNDKPWKQSLPTVKQFEINDTEPFQTEKDKLVEVVETFHNKATNLHWPEHPAFGSFTNDQWGKMQYKHLDHHLRQFGA